MQRFLAFLFFVAVAATENGNSTEKFELQTKDGKVLGSYMTSRLGRRIYSFRGLRYAEAPVGQQRFKPPIPISSWKDEVFDASEEGPSCPQPGGELQSEDCLRLSVYTTELPSPGSETKKPVIVFFHPGGFYVGSGQSLNVGPHYLLDQDIVLVGVNYRLGSLGFISTGDSLAPGNLGLKDQVEALKWVKKNIATFGGDPDCVTITGNSAGAWSVSLHLVSPMSKGLFHRAIAMSGAATYQTPTEHDQKRLATKQAEFLGCPTDTTGNMLICLNSISAEKISATLPQFFEWHGDPILVWSPVIEPEVPGVERFLTADPSDLIRQGKFENVPIMTGITKDEFGGVVTILINEIRKGNLSTLDDFNENWNTIAPISFLYERNSSRSLEISQALKEFYLGGKPISLENMDGLANLYADGVIGFQTHRFADLIADARKPMKAPVYYYEFAYQGRYGYGYWPGTQTPYGVGHMDDLIYLFTISRFPYFESTAPELKTVERLTKIWGHFAKTGEPLSSDQFPNITWTPYTVENRDYLRIGEELETKKNLNAERMNLWDRLFPLKPLEECH